MQGATVELVPGCGHFPWLERPGVVADALSRFLARSSDQDVGLIPVVLREPFADDLMYRSRSSTCGMWDDSSNRTHSASEMPPWRTCCNAGVASSRRPETSSVGTKIRPADPSCQSLNEPTTWNSLGPFIV